jgi:hypothetical protein
VITEKSRFSNPVFRMIEGLEPERGFDFEDVKIKNIFAYVVLG